MTNIHENKNLTTIVLFDGWYNGTYYVTIKEWADLDGRDSLSLRFGTISERTGGKILIFIKIYCPVII